MTSFASAVVSSRGSRRPELDRQCTHARLQAYVSSHVRQMGESSPSAKWSISFILMLSASYFLPRFGPSMAHRSARLPVPLVDHVGRGQLRQGFFELRHRLLVHAGLYAGLASSR